MAGKPLKFLKNLRKAARSDPDGCHEPEMDGYEATERIRRLNRKDARTIPIIAMTANAFTEDKIRSKAAGMNEHIAKPLNMELVFQAVAKLVQPPVVD